MEVSVILYILLAAVIVPPLLASLYIARQSTPALRIPMRIRFWGGLSMWRSRYLVQMACERDRDYRTLQACLKACRELISAATQSEKDLTRKLIASRQKAQAFERRAAKKPEDQRQQWKTKAADERSEAAKVEEQLVEKMLELRDLNKQHNELEGDLIRTWTRVQISVAEAKVAIAEAKAARAGERNLHLGAIFSARQVFAKVEAKVIQRELDADRMFLAVHRTSDAEIRMIEDAAAKVASIREGINSKFEAINKAVIHADPNIDRAYQRLNEHLLFAKKLAQASNKEEEELERQVEDLKVKAQLLRKRLAKYNSEGNQFHVDRSRDHLIECRRVLRDLSRALKSHRRKNLSIEQALYRVDWTVRRLHVIKLMLSALPGSKTDEILQFTKFADALCRYVKDAFNPDAEQEPPIDFAQRVAALEGKTLMAYIRIAKGQSTRLSERAKRRFVSDVSTISKAIELERLDASWEFEKWNSVAQEAIHDKRKLLHVVATQRSQQSAGILKATEQSLEVLSIITALNAPKDKKPEQAIG